MVDDDLGDFDDLDQMVTTAQPDEDEPHATHAVGHGHHVGVGVASHHAHAHAHAHVQAHAHAAGPGSAMHAAQMLVHHTGGHHMSHMSAVQHLGVPHHLAGGAHHGVEALRGMHPGAHGMHALQSSGLGGAEKVYLDHGYELGGGGGVGAGMMLPGGDVEHDVGRRERGGGAGELQGHSQGGGGGGMGNEAGPRKHVRKSSKWSPEEDLKLRHLVEDLREGDWKVVSQHFDDREPVQCMHRWNEVLHPELIKGPWTPEEDELLRELVQKYGEHTKKWAEISSHFKGKSGHMDENGTTKTPGRIGKRCRERWYNHLRPTLVQAAAAQLSVTWTQEEKDLLESQVAAIGTKWTEISRMLPGKSDNACKNYWNAKKRKAERREEAARSGRVFGSRGRKPKPKPEKDPNVERRKRGRPARPRGTPEEEALRKRNRQAASASHAGEVAGGEGSEYGADKVEASQAATKPDATLKRQGKAGMPWSDEEHNLFIKALAEGLKGDWKAIAKKYLPNRSPKMVASHAQKYYLRQKQEAEGDIQDGSKKKRRASIHDPQDDREKAEAEGGGHKLSDVLDDEDSGAGVSHSGSRGLDARGGGTADDVGIVRHHPGRGGELPPEEPPLAQDPANVLGLARNAMNLASAAGK